MRRPFTCGPLRPADAEAASELILECFWRFNADQYGDNTQAFTDSVTPQRLRDFIADELVLGARDQDGALCGVICITGGAHLELLFVKADHHRRGVASALWDAALAMVSAPRGGVDITVNSSDYAIAVYERFGFVRTPHERPIVKRLRFQRPSRPGL